MSRQKWKTQEIHLDLNNLVCGGLLAILIIILQAFISEGLRNIFAYIVVLSLTVAMPCLAGCLFCKLIEGKYPYQRHARFFNTLYAFGVFGGFVTVAATIWYIFWVAGIVFLIVSASALALSMLHSKQLSEDEEELKKWE